MKKSKIFVGALLLFFYGCASVKAPYNWLPEPEYTVKELYGAWITIEIQNEPNTIGGEFIAFQNDSLFVFTSQGIPSISREKVVNVVIDLYQRETNKVALWSILGTLSTISHGFFLGISAPIWIISGISSGVSASHGGLFEKDNPSNEWLESMKKFSRFPNGLPPSIRLEELKPKIAVYE
ncbi:MAG: hypothetical protein ABIG69_09165 [Bacteroidota bacterium]